MKKLLRAFSILLCLTLTFAGCNGSVSNKETEGSVELAGNGKIYPLKTEESISWWLNFSGYAGTVYNICPKRRLVRHWLNKQVLILNLSILRHPI